MSATNTLRVAIVTKYHGPTNTKGSRISADAGLKRRVTIPFDYSLSTFDAHAKAAQALCDKFGWEVELTGGDIERGYAFTMTDKAA